MSVNLSRRLVAEAIGTFAIVFMGCGALMISERFPGSMPPGSVALVFGFVVAILIYTLGHISQAHFNPAVTLAFSLIGRFKKDEVPLYILSQCLGALCASLALAWLLPAGASFGGTFPTVPPAQAFAWETLLTFFLMFSVMAIATDERAVGSLGGVVVGTVVALDALVGGPVTGASMNPARSIAPAIFEGRLENLWIYIAGPCLGAILAAVLYQWIRQENPSSSKADLEKKSVAESPDYCA